MDARSLLNVMNLNLGIMKSLAIRILHYVDANFGFKLIFILFIFGLAVSFNAFVYSSVHKEQRAFLEARQARYSSQRAAFEAEQLANDPMLREAKSGITPDAILAESAAFSGQSIKPVAITNHDAF